MCKFTIDDAIEHATDVAQRKYLIDFVAKKNVANMNFVEDVM